MANNSGKGRRGIHRTSSASSRRPRGRRASRKFCGRPEDP